MGRAKVALGIFFLLRKVVFEALALSWFQQHSRFIIKWSTEFSPRRSKLTSRYCSTPTWTAEMSHGFPNLFQSVSGEIRTFPRSSEIVQHSSRYAPRYLKLDPWSSKVCPRCPHGALRWFCGALNWFNSILKYFCGTQKFFHGSTNLLRGAQLCPHGALRYLRGASKSFGEVPKWFHGASKCNNGVPDLLRGAPSLFSVAPNLLCGAQLCPRGAFRRVFGASKWFRRVRMCLYVASKCIQTAPNFLHGAPILILRAPNFLRGAPKLVHGPPSSPYGTLKCLHWTSNWFLGATKFFRGNPKSFHGIPNLQMPFFRNFAPPIILPTSASGRGSKDAGKEFLLGAGGGGLPQDFGLMEWGHGPHQKFVGGKISEKMSKYLVLKGSKRFLGTCGTAKIAQFSPNSRFLLQF